MIREYETDHDWKFLYLGANVDAFAEAGGLAISEGTALLTSNTSQGLQGAYKAFSTNMLECRGMLQQNTPTDVAFTAYDFDEEQRQASQR
jgi:hypothetical protein